MGKVKQNKRLSAHRTAGDPMGSKLPLADEIESLKLAKSKTNELGNSKKRQADDEEFVNEKMTAKILMQARKQQSELQDEFGIGDDNDEPQVETTKQQKTKFLLTTKSDDFETTTSGTASGFNFRPFKKLQTSRLQQQQIRKSDHDDSDSDSDTDEHLEDCENKRDFYSDEEIVIF